MGRAKIQGGTSFCLLGLEREEDGCIMKERLLQLPVAEG